MACSCGFSRCAITHYTPGKRYGSTPSYQPELTNLPVSTLHFTTHPLIVMVNITSHNTISNKVVINIRPSNGFFQLPIQNPDIQDPKYSNATGYPANFLEFVTGSQRAQSGPFPQAAAGNLKSKRRAAPLLSSSYR